MKMIYTLLFLTVLVVAPVGCMKRGDDVRLSTGKTGVPISDRARISILEKHLLGNPNSSKEEMEYLKGLKMQAQEEESEQID